MFTISWQNAMDYLLSWFTEYKLILNFMKFVKLCILMTTILGMIFVQKGLLD